MTDAETMDPYELLELAVEPTKAEGFDEWFARRIKAAVHYWVCFLACDENAVVVPLPWDKGVRVGPFLERNPGLMAGWEYRIETTDSEYKGRNALILMPLERHYWVEIRSIKVCAKCGASQCWDHPWPWFRMRCVDAISKSPIQGNNPQDLAASDWAYLLQGRGWQPGPNLDPRLTLGKCCIIC